MVTHCMKTFWIIVLILIIPLIIFYYPIITIWALNTVFKLEIAYGWPAWLAVLWLIMTLSHSRWGNDKD
jgi:hypothetical protein